jgi:hypothetical protein
MPKLRLPAIASLFVPRLNLGGAPVEGVGAREGSGVLSLLVMAKHVYYLSIRVVTQAVVPDRTEIEQAQTGILNYWAFLNRTDLAVYLPFRFLSGVKYLVPPWDKINGTNLGTNFSKF